MHMIIYLSGITGWISRFIYF